MPTTTTKEFVIPLENKPGTLADVAATLGKANVNIQAYLLEAQGDFGVFRFVPSDVAKTESWLKTANRPYRVNDVVTVTVANKPGELGRIAQKLAASGVNIVASYPVAPSGSETQIAFAVNDVATAKKVLG